MTRVRTLIVFSVVAAVAAGAVLTQRWWHNHPPYRPSALHASATLRPVTNEQAQAFLGPAVNAPLIGTGGQLIAGEVRWRRPPRSVGYFSLYVIDERTHAKPSYITTGSAGVAVGSSPWDTKVAARYSWLRGAGATYRDGSWWETGEDLSVLVASGATTVTFVAVFPSADSGDPARRTDAAAPVDVSHLLVGLVFVGDDGQLYWPQRLHG
ncbi:hypothetical protein GCM10023322_07410 [Rugosimonospora acidiphila]|uniref:SURF1-like protein n=1 Tax=Rugosimonospora acidiphila TaxID=556531 RepID=A0ABP9RKZ8_9ACTN